MKQRRTVQSIISKRYPVTILKPGDKFVSYLLWSEKNGRTYIGFTKNIAKRLRQHNGEITGGARSTRSGRPWKLIGYIMGMKTRGEGLAIERLWKRSKGLKYREARAKSIVQESNGRFQWIKFHSK